MGWSGAMKKVGSLLAPLIEVRLGQSCDDGSSKEQPVSRISNFPPSQTKGLVPYIDFFYSL